MKLKVQITPIFLAFLERLDMIRTENKFFENFIWLNTKEAAEYLRTSPKQVRKWVYQDKIRVYKLLGKSLRFKKTDLDFLFKGDLKWE